MNEFIIKNIIAIIALVISLYTLYRTNLSPFSLKVTNAGRISLSKDPMVLALTHALFFIDLLFSNSGARKGVVEDVAIKMDDNGVPLIFFSKYVNLDRQMNLSPEAPPPQLEPFIGFEIDKDESIIKQIGFIQKPGEPRFSYRLGGYQADIHVYDSKHDKWFHKNSIRFNVEQEDIDQLNKMTQTRRPNGNYAIKMIVQNKRTTQALDRLESLKNG